MKFEKKLLLAFLLTSLIIFSFSFVGFAETEEGGIFQMAGNITIPEDKVINGDVDAMAGNITIYGTVNGDVTAMAGNITIYGKIDGDVRCVAGKVILRENGEVTGEVTALAGKVIQDTNTKISGEITQLESSEGGIRIPTDFSEIRDLSDIFERSQLPWYLVIWGGVTGLISWLAIGVLIMFFFTKQIKRLAENIEKRPLYYFLVGLVGYLLTPIAIIVLAITIVGIPAIPVLIILIIIGTIFGQLGVARIVGEKLQEMFNLKLSTEMAKVIVGILAIFLITLIPVLGWILFFVTACMGFGSAIINKFGIERKDDSEDA